MYGQFVAYKSTWPELHIDAGSPKNNGEMTEEKYSLYLKNEHAWSHTLTSIATIEATLKEQTRLNDGGIPLSAVQQAVKQWHYAGEFGLRYTGIEHHLLQAGVQGEFDHNFGTFFTFLAPGQPGFIPRTTLVDDDDFGIGFYVDDEYRLNDRLKLIGGLRVDTNTRLRNDRWFPGARAGIIFEPTKTWVSKVIYNRAIRMPTALEAMNEVWGTNNPPARNSRLSPPFSDRRSTGNPLDC